MVEGPPTLRVEVTFNGSVPERQVRRASGVSNVEVVGHALHCHVCGSFQPFLEAMSGYEILSLRSTPMPPKAD
jgi:hypothetical protein